GAVDRAVDALVELHQVALARDPCALDLVEERLDLLAVGAAELLRRKLRGVRLEHHADLGDAGEVGDVHVGHEGAAVGHRADEVLARQSLQGLANRRPADLQLLAQAGLVDDRARRHLQADYAVADAQVRLVALRQPNYRFGDRHIQRPSPGRPDIRPIYRRGT